LSGRCSNTCSIYKITNNINNKIYIGQTWKLIADRFKEHKYPNSGCLKLRRAIKKYGKEQFIITLILFTHTQETADYWENYLF
jgi:group I intron endonuclease